MSETLDPFVNLVGQDQAVALLRAAIAQDRLAPAYLVLGPEGVGRGRLALGFSELILRQGSPPERWPALARSVRARNHPDLLWVEPTYTHKGELLTVSEAEAQGLQRRSLPQIRIEQVRAIAKFLARPPLLADRAVVVVASAEQMAEAPANALLKTLEEPGRATLILIAPGPEALLPTLVSRCQRLPCRRLSRAELTQVLTRLGRDDLLQDPTLLAWAQGSPGAVLTGAAQGAAIAPELRQALLTPPRDPLEALNLAKQVEQSLDVAAQVWLLDYLQPHYWQDYRTQGWRQLPLPLLDQARQHLLHYVQPRLVWECLLLALGEIRL